MIVYNMCRHQYSSVARLSMFVILYLLCLTYSTYISKTTIEFIHGVFLPPLTHTKTRRLLDLHAKAHHWPKAKLLLYKSIVATFSPGMVVMLPIILCVNGVSAHSIAPFRLAGDERRNQDNTGVMHMPPTGYLETVQTACSIRSYRETFVVT